MEFEHMEIDKAFHSLQWLRALSIFDWLRTMQKQELAIDCDFDV